MKRSFDYFYITTSSDSMTVDDIGNCKIKICNDMGYEWFLIIETILGDSHIQQFGPFFNDIDNFFPQGFKYSYFKLPYHEGKISKIIESFINDEKKSITQAFQLDEDSENPLEKLCSINFLKIYENR